jgi:hypothetical protein
MQGHYLLNYYLYDEQWLTSPQFIIGIYWVTGKLEIDFMLMCLLFFSGFTMFCVGMAINIHSGTLIKKGLNRRS